MKILLLIVMTLVGPLESQAVGNRDLHCRSKSAELVFHTVMHGEIAVGDYTILNGERADFPPEASYGGMEGTKLVFYNQNRIFQVETTPDSTELEFTLLAQLFGSEPTPLETGNCEEIE